jgi:hypothetical protein
LRNNYVKGTINVVNTKIHKNLEKQCKDDQRLNRGKLKRRLASAGAGGV